METFLLNDNGEVLLEIKSGFDFQNELSLIVDEKNNSAKLKEENKSVDINYVHSDLMPFLKKRGYLYIVERDENFSIIHQAVGKIVFVA